MASAIISDGLGWCFSHFSPMGLGPHCKHVQVEVLFVDYGFILDLDLEEMIQNTCAYQQHEG